MRIFRRLVSAIKAKAPERRPAPARPVRPPLLCPVCGVEGHGLETCFAVIRLGETGRTWPGGGGLNGLGPTFDAQREFRERVRDALRMREEG